MPLPQFSTDDGETVGWLADREFLKAQHRACVTLLAHLAESGLVPAQHGLFLYLDALNRAFEEREAELSVPSIRSGRRNRLEREALAEARSLYLEEAGSKYIRDVVAPKRGPAKRTR